MSSSWYAFGRNIAYGLAAASAAASQKTALLRDLKKAPPEARPLLAYRALLIPTGAMPPYQPRMTDEELEDFARGLLSDQSFPVAPSPFPNGTSEI